ncbi:J domain-containing protein [Natronorubrum bangense]|uniref:Heat shock protein DnaJ domain-containing protein n=2 Tax=Natronorubrum bangense TaxID=61858 RepID=L9WKG9_9EURY|nr:DnaJ domain-containing protein [Natronorubrum bangense]ELY49949.1 heat shock protein DnaJ domain-containing protein [Natronorubrum bangense JCM 10635]QCC55564.1 molecular chaperone DnaJ [Natronorubrum bangense]
MAVADDRHAGCDGCGRAVPLEELTVVTMPDGEHVACCPRCEPHAREAARKCSSLDQRRGTCDGCTETVLEVELEDIVLNDGTVVSCCPACVAKAPDNDSEATATRADADTTAEPTDGSDSDTDDEETLCTQCNEWVRAELFHVTTIDDRTERLCPTCKDSAEDDGIIKDVEIRKTKAREVLGVEPGATDEEIRTAFHTQIKRAHPDQQSGSRSAFQLVRDAYERLTEAT